MRKSMFLILVSLATAGVSSFAESGASQPLGSRNTASWAGGVIYCSAPKGYLGQFVTIYNTSKKAAEGVVVMHLTYSVKGQSTRKVDSLTVPFMAPPGRSAFTGLGSSAVGYGCNGVASMIGEVQSHSLSSLTVGVTTMSYEYLNTTNHKVGTSFGTGTVNGGQIPVKYPPAMRVASPRSSSGAGNSPSDSSSVSDETSSPSNDD